jgi:hypothetical protein
MAQAVSNVRVGVSLTGRRLILNLHLVIAAQFSSAVVGQSKVISANRRLAYIYFLPT